MSAITVGSGEPGERTPNPDVLARIFERVAEWEEEQAENAPMEEPTTERVYTPVATLDAQHRAAFRELMSAVAKGDSKAALAAFNKIQYIEIRQRTAHQNVREYALQKARSHAKG